MKKQHNPPPPQGSKPPPSRGEDVNPDVRLIAAAPALLAALEAAQEWMSPLSVNLAARTNGLDDVLAQVNAAIAAAKEAK